jgi:uncharacterized protein YdeI (BOF family)
MNKMVKKVLTLVVISSVISAALLYVGITILGVNTPAFAASLDALVAGTGTRDLPGAESATVRQPLSNQQDKASDDLKTSSSSSSNSSSAAASSQSATVLAQSASETTPATSITIAELLQNPKQYLDQVFTITGIATDLNDEKFLLNDGTGQILVETDDDDLEDFVIVSGTTITVTGKFDDYNDSSSYKLEAITLVDQFGNTFTDDDDMDDDDMDDDDMDDDDMDDDDSDDDDMDDDDSDDDDMDDDDSDDDDSDSDDD